MTTRTLTEIEADYMPVSQVAREYLNGDYGDPSEWDAKSIAQSELDGDTGDQLPPEEAAVFAGAVGAAFEALRDNAA